MTLVALEDRVTVDRDDPAGFSAWVRPHLPAMAALAARLTSYDDRDDIVQEALVRAWRRWSTYDDTRAPLPWLLAITADRARRRKPTVALPFDLDPTSTDVDADLDLERALQQLTERQRLAVALHYFVGLPVGETAAVMTCSPGTVKSTLYDARTRLRALLEDES